MVGEPKPVLVQRNSGKAGLGEEWAGGKKGQEGHHRERRWGMSSQLSCKLCGGVVRATS